MELNGKDVQSKWVAYISEIKKKFVNAELQQIYPEKTPVKSYVNLPNEMFDKEHLRLGQVFYLYMIDGKFEIEFMKRREWTDEELKEAEEKTQELLRELKFD